jgi:hypothetical protein
MGMGVEEIETMGIKAEERDDASMLARFIGDVLGAFAMLSILWGVLIILGAGLTALLLAGSPTYAEAGGFAKAAVWVVWLSVVGITAFVKWRIFIRETEAKGYSWEEVYGSMIREYMPVAIPPALLAVALTIVICRLDHAEYILGLWLMAGGCPTIALGARWNLRLIIVSGGVLFGLGLLQVALWPTHVLATLVAFGIFYILLGGYIWKEY